MEINEVETNTGTVKNAADRIMELMDGDPPREPEGDTHPEAEAQSEPKQQAEQEEVTEAANEADVEPTSEPTDEPDPVTSLIELADTMNVEEEYLESLVVPTKVNGSERSPTIKDLISHYQKGESAEVKLMELSEQRKAFESELSKQQAVIKERESLAETLLTQLEAELSSDSSDIDSLRYADPAEYAARMTERTAKREKAEMLKRQHMEAASQRMMEQYQHARKVELQKVLQVIPEWGDEKIAQKETSELRNYMQANGFEAWEIDGKMENGVIQHPGLLDHRYVQMARKAWLYDQSGKSSESKKAKMRSIPKVGSGKRKTKQEVTQEQVDEVRGRVRKTGSMKDAALAIEQMMQRGN